MRFEGKGISLVEEGLLFTPQGTLTALDAVGTIYAFEPAFTSNEDESNSFSFQGAYEPNGLRSVETASTLLPSRGMGVFVRDGDHYLLYSDVFCPNFIGFRSSTFNPASFILTGLNMFYSSDSYHTGIKAIGLSSRFYGTYMTDWYPAPYTFADMADNTPDVMFFQALLDWINATYPDLDWSRFDQNADGYIDSLILLNAGDNSERTYYSPLSFSGGARFMNCYTTEQAGTQYRPTVNDYMVCHSDLFDTNVIIHEFGHSLLGLIDYYDVTYSGIDAVGKYNMQSSNAGDWNACSKYAVGWIEPTIVTGLQPGETREITIGSMSVTGDAIVIPAAEARQDGTPFNEYILIDLFTDEGLHRYDAAQYHLNGVKGVRIYHVNAEMERRELTYRLAGNTTFPVGTVHVANNYKNDDLGQYHIELIQRGGKNTFTNLKNLRTQVEKKDFFVTGDQFTVEGYKEFFYDGKMDDGLSFGYTVKVVFIRTNGNGETQAVISITRQE